MSWVAMFGGTGLLVSIVAYFVVIFAPVYTSSNSDFGTFVWRYPNRISLAFVLSWIVLAVMYTYG